MRLERQRSEGRRRPTPISARSWTASTAGCRRRWHLRRDRRCRCAVRRPRLPRAGLDRWVCAPGRVYVGGRGHPMVRMYTSGTTGRPKGVVPSPSRAHGRPGSSTSSSVCDVTDDDVFWNAADPGWAYGLYYAIVGPLASGIRSILVHAGFSPELTWQVFEKFGVTNFAAAPTVYRGLRAAGQPAVGHMLRRASSRR